MLKADNLDTFVCRVSRNSGSLKTPETLRGSIQACNGIDLQAQPVRLAGLSSVTLRYRVWLTLVLLLGASSLFCCKNNNVWYLCICLTQLYLLVVYTAFAKLGATTCFGH